MVKLHVGIESLNSSSLKVSQTSSSSSTRCCSSMDFSPVVQVACVLIPLFLVRSWLTHQRNGSMPPGPPALPILGHLHLLGKLPHHSLMQIARRYGPLVKLQLGSVPVVLASSPSIAKEFLQTHDLVFASRPSSLVAKIVLYDAKDMVFAPYGEHWRSLRKLCMLELLNEKHLGCFQNVWVEELRNMMIRLAEASRRKEAVVVRQYLTELTFNIMTRLIMNKVYFGSKVNGEEARQFTKLQHEAIKLVGKVFISDYIPYLKWLDYFNVIELKALDKFQDQFLQKIVDEHRDKMKDNSLQDERLDFVDIMLMNLPFSTEKEQNTIIKALITDLLGAGTDTTTTAIQWALAELLNNPHALAKAQHELQSVSKRETGLVQEFDLPKLEYLQAVIKETFRLHPPAPLLIPHESSEACKVGEYNIVKGTRLFVNVYAIGRDPSVWDKPEQFLPERFLNSSIDVQGRDFELLPFGSGRRGCPGLSLGLKSLQLALANLLWGFDWTLPSGMTSHSMAECFGVVVSMAEALKAVPSARYPLHVYSGL